MRFAFSLGAAVALALSVWLPCPTWAEDDLGNQGGISSPLLSRCAGKFGAQLRAADNAFPLLSLLGVPWMAIERTDQTVDGAHIVAIVTGIGGLNRRRGQIVGVRYRCLIDDKGAAANFTWNDVLPERNETLPPAVMVRGSAYSRPKAQLPPGAELRVQLVDRASDPPVLVTESVVRSSWVQPIPFGLRLPRDTRLEGRNLALDVRLALGAQTLYRLKEPRALDVAHLQQPVDLNIDAVVPSGVE